MGRATVIAGVHFVRSARAGKPIRWYIYAWRGGPCIRKIEQAARPKLNREDVAAIAEAQATNLAPSDTMSGLIILWHVSPEWKAFAQSTRTLWDRICLAIDAKWGKTPLGLWNDPRMTVKVVNWRDDMSDTPRSADEHIKVLRLLLTWAQLRGYVSCNIAAPVPRLWKGGDRAEIIWSPEDCAAFDEVAPRWLVDARHLAELTGLRRADLCALTWSDINDTHIGRTAAKKSAGRRRRTIMPIVPGLRELLTELRKRHRVAGVETVLVGAKGRPLAPRTLTAQFILFRRAANGGNGILHAANADGERPRAKTLHDLRGTFATRLMTLPGGGLTDDQIAAIMGWSPRDVAAIRRRYVDEAAIVVAIGQRINSRTL